MERRLITASQLEVRAQDETPKIVGYASVFNQPIELYWGFSEQVAPGAFKKSIAAGDVRALWDHDSAFVLGRTKAGTLRLEEDNYGLRVEIDPPKTPLADSFLESIRRGDVSGMSFGFVVEKEEWENLPDGKRLRTLLEVQLFEVSAVAFPAYPTTEVALRSLMGDEPHPPQEEPPVEAAVEVTDESNEQALVERSEAADGDGQRALLEHRARRLRIAYANKY